MIVDVLNMLLIIVVIVLDINVLFIFGIFFFLLSILVLLVRFINVLMLLNIFMRVNVNIIVKRLRRIVFMLFFWLCAVNKFVKLKLKVEILNDFSENLNFDKFIIFKGKFIIVVIIILIIIVFFIFFVIKILIIKSFIRVIIVLCEDIIVEFIFGLFVKDLKVDVKLLNFGSLELGFIIIILLFINFIKVIKSLIFVVMVCFKD